MSAATQTLGTGYYVTAAGTSGGIGTGINYADPYVGSHAPEFSFFNFGMQRQVTKNMTVSVDYSGSQSHFISGASNIRDLYSSEIDPKYLVLGTYLSKPATAANIAAAQTASGLTLPVPYAGYTAFASLNATTGTQGTIAHMLTWKPQYSSTSDYWGNYVANGKGSEDAEVFAVAAHGEVEWGTSSRCVVEDHDDATVFEGDGIETGVVAGEIEEVSGRPGEAAVIRV